MVLDLITIINYQVGLNEVWRYLVFLIVLSATYPVGKVIIYVLQNYLKKWVAKTAFKLDDIFFNSINPSITMFVFAGLFYIASGFINQGQYKLIFDKAFNLFIIVPLVYFLIKFSTEMIGFYLKGDKKRINETGIDLLMQIVRISLFFIGILLILGNLGYNVSALLAGLGVGGLAFALAAQDILKNFFAGVALVFDKTFNKGERIQFQGVTGKIEELKMRSTKVRTYDGTLMTIPNAMLADNMVENVTKVPKVKVKMTIGVEYSTSAAKLEEAKKIIQEAIDSNEFADVGNHDVWFDNFGAYSLDIQVIYYGVLTMNDWSKRVALKDGVNFAIKKGFEKAKISIAFPTQTIELRK